MKLSTPYIRLVLEITLAAALIELVIMRLVPLSLSAEVMTITSQVRVQVVCDSHQTSRSLATHELIQPLAINIDPTTLVAKFTLHFLDGGDSTQCVINGTHAKRFHAMC